ncbi:MAG: hypothetical protein H7X91_10100, partial [Burkholderiales bacterium]|nr:hypothetical protein [Burkholderiales bacterium]
MKTNTLRASLLLAILSSACADQNADKGKPQVTKETETEVVKSPAVKNTEAEKSMAVAQASKGEAAAPKADPAAPAAGAAAPKADAPKADAPKADAAPAAGAAAPKADAAPA